jgi:hypothetical protein
MALDPVCGRADLRPLQADALQSHRPCKRSVRNKKASAGPTPSGTINPTTSTQVARGALETVTVDRTFAWHWQMPKTGKGCREINRLFRGLDQDRPHSPDQQTTCKVSISLRTFRARLSETMHSSEYLFIIRSALIDWDQYILKTITANN